MKQLFYTFSHLLICMSLHEGLNTLTNAIQCKKGEVKDRLTDWLTEWLMTDWLTDWLNEWMNEWKSEWMNEIKGNRPIQTPQTSLNESTNALPIDAVSWGLWYSDLSTITTCEKTSNKSFIHLLAEIIITPIHTARRTETSSRTKKSFGTR